MYCSRRSRPRKNHQNDFEKVTNKQRMAGFVEKSSHAYLDLCRRYGPKPSQQELLSLAQAISETLQILLDREAFRRKKVLIKWFDENYAVIEPFLDRNVLILDGAGKPIGDDPRENKVKQGSRR